MKGVALILSLTTAAAAALPEVARPDFSDSGEVVSSLDAIVGNLQTAAGDDPASWQVGRALGNCREVRRTVAQWLLVGAYDPRGAERLWQECRRTYDAVH